MRHLIAACLLIASLIHLLPALGVLGAERLAQLYGLNLSEPNLLILMRHRAVLFGVVAGLLLWAVLAPALRPAAFAAGLASVLSFLVLARMSGDHNAQLARVVMVDWFALGVLAAGAAAQLVLQLREPLSG
ncbi:phosphopantetheine adenylyltransferase [Aquabacterium sp.]|uniref:phosphopantetheine adenylyltransferase n=1 Tax=Aquabacterium sp. TaxID=1872578 RepID=UPI002BE5B376|nr:phosphopantetheine adenylyltransferase [Aquabacterium sp.]HSW07269.1 phosphopantetheine adenylyltransferase [Aquabacterium sp.]